MYYFMSVAVIVLLFSCVMFFNKKGAGDPDIELKENNVNRMMSRYRT